MKDKDGILSKFNRRQRYKKVLPFIGGDVLEIGCGAAEAYRHYGERMQSYTGIDKQSRFSSILKDGKIAAFYQADIDVCSLAPLLDIYDCILMIALIEHLTNHQFALTQAVHRLRSKGVIVITTPTPLGNFVHRILGMFRLLNPCAWQDHFLIYNRRRFAMIAEKVGLKIKHYQKFQFGMNQLCILGLR
jgi:SAM-dependent methyltransferase